MCELLVKLYSSITTVDGEISLMAQPWRLLKFHLISLVYFSNKK